MCKGEIRSPANGSAPRVFSCTVLAFSFFPRFAGVLSRESRRGQAQCLACASPAGRDWTVCWFFAYRGKRGIEKKKRNSLATLAEWPTRTNWWRRWIYEIDAIVGYMRICVLIPSWTTAETLPVDERLKSDSQVTRHRASFVLLRV